jgi:hypothetical protein
MRRRSKRQQAVVDNGEEQEGPILEGGLAPKNALCLGGQQGQFLDGDRDGGGGGGGEAARPRPCTANANAS